jgi:light-regulated signal transduction histidine kinase (bacteriophytochrome)
MHEEPVGEAEYVSDLLKIFAKRTEIELERIRNGEELEATNRELDTINRKLRQSNDDLLQFAHVASHDLKEPLRKMKTFANRLEDDEQSRLSEKGRNYLSKVQSASDRMFSMVDGVLAYSAMNTSEQRFEVIDLNALFQSIFTDLELLIEQNRAVIHKDSLPQIEGAAPLIYQLFYNLIKNSLKFIREGIRPMISITSEMTPVRDEPFTEITIEDNGIGFDEQYAERIFDPFTRLNSREKYEGTGLGLALCKKIVLRHGGSITGRGNKSRGTEFIVSLPVKQKENNY